jgi:hypothetical protein
LKVRRPIVCQKCAEFRKQSLVGQRLSTDGPSAGSLRRPASNPILSDLVRAVCVPDSLLRTHPEVGTHDKRTPRGENPRSRVDLRTYACQCTVCRKFLNRKTMNGSLSPHKNCQDYPCYGRYRVYVRTKNLSSNCEFAKGSRLQPLLRLRRHTDPQMPNYHPHSVPR